jgi:predicted nucleic acid-binding protein
MAEAYLFDTNAISDAMREHAQLIAAMHSHSGEFVTSAVVQGEILYGVRRLTSGVRRDELMLKADRIFAALICRPVDENVALIYADLRPLLENRGLAVNDNDLWIAATTIAADAVLVTRDADFKHVPHLRVVDWTQTDATE